MGLGQGRLGEESRIGTEVDVEVIFMRAGCKRLKSEIVLRNIAEREECVAVEGDLVETDGIGLLHRDMFGIEGAETAECIIEDDDAVGFEARMDNGEFADIVEAAAVGAGSGKLVDKSGGARSEATTVGEERMTVVDGKLFEVGVIDNEGLAIESIGVDGAGAIEFEFGADMYFDSSIAEGGIVALIEEIFGIGSRGRGLSDGGKGEGTKCKKERKI